jgi:hypothetical protein
MDFCEYGYLIYCTAVVFVINCHLPPPKKVASGNTQPTEKIQFTEKQLQHKTPLIHKISIFTETY